MANCACAVITFSLDTTPTFSKASACFTNASTWMFVAPPVVSRICLNLFCCFSASIAAFTAEIAPAERAANVAAAGTLKLLIPALNLLKPPSARLISDTALSNPCGFHWDRIGIIIAIVKPSLVD